MCGTCNSGNWYGAKLWTCVLQYFDVTIHVYGSLIFYIKMNKCCNTQKTAMYISDI